tara:strand:+ start:3955 stop:5373 length:1419 start_codon:yes stop_codon:yes gene_type:complete
MGFSTIGGASTGGSAETPSGGAGSAEHAGVEDNSSSNADQIQINDASVVINKDNEDVDFIVEASGAANALVVQGSDGHVGVGVAAPLNPLTVYADDNTSSNTATFRDSAGNLKFQFYLEADSSPSLYLNGSSKCAIKEGGDSFFAGGSLGVGTTTPDSLLEVSKASADAEVLISCYHNTDATTPKITMRKADGSEASPALVGDNGVLGTISFQGHDGSGFHEGAKIEARVKGTSSDGADLPSELSFWTTPDGSGSTSQRMTLSENGSLGIGSTSPTAAVQVYKAISADDLGDYDNYQLMLAGHSTAGNTVGILMTTSSTSNGGSAIVHHRTGTYGKGDLAFYTKQGGDGVPPVEVMRLGDDGRGISDFTAFAWATYDDTQTQFQALVAAGSHNMASIAAGTTNSGTGTYKFTFTVAAGNANYCVVAGGDSDTTGYVGAIQGKTATTHFEVYGSEGGAFNDLDEVHVLVFATS